MPQDPARINTGKWPLISHGTAKVHAYPEELARFVLDKWDEVDGGDPIHYPATTQSSLHSPNRTVLEALISSSYQASLLFEEQRPVTFRMIFCEPERFPPDEGPPTGLQPMVFSEPRPFAASELRQLFPAVNFHRSLIGVKLDEKAGLLIWGFVQSGPRWMRTLLGGRGGAQPMPPSLVISVNGPGLIEVSKGQTPIARLGQGRLAASSLNLFDSKWLPEFFEKERDDHVDCHLGEKEERGEDWADLDPEFAKIISQHMVKRIIATIRSLKHGGTLLVVPNERVNSLLKKNPYIHVHYEFADQEPRARFSTLIVSALNALAEAGGRFNLAMSRSEPVGWDFYEKSNDSKLAMIDEAVFEMSSMIASLTSVDGAVVLNKSFEVIGFGAEIACDSADVGTVCRARDLEGEQFQLESTFGLGTRHRSAYRFCHELQDSLAIVISQDGSVRFAKFIGPNVMYWDQRVAPGTVLA